MIGKRILLVDDDADVLSLLEDIYILYGADTCKATTGREGLAELYAQRPDLVVLDIMMPDMDGLQACSRIRQISDVPIILLTAFGTTDDIVRGLDCGAVDYVAKPFNVRELLARSRAALRQAANGGGPASRETYSDDHLAIDLESRQVMVRGQSVNLSAKEFDLLAYLLRHAGRTLTFMQILQSVWGWEYQNNTEYVHAAMWRLRQRVEPDPKKPRYLLSERGVGYRFEPHGRGHAR
jgi:two-component system KDP operon response regulator KdpE